MILRVMGDSLAAFKMHERQGFVLTGVTEIDPLGRDGVKKHQLELRW